MCVHIMVGEYRSFDWGFTFQGQNVDDKGKIKHQTQNLGKRQK